MAQAHPADALGRMGIQTQLSGLEPAALNHNTKPEETLPAKAGDAKLGGAGCRWSWLLPPLSYLKHRVQVDILLVPANFVEHQESQNSNSFLAGAPETSSLLGGK